MKVEIQRFIKDLALWRRGKITDIDIGNRKNH